MNKISRQALSHKQYFKVYSRLGILISTSRAYWNVITHIKHPTVRGKEGEVKSVLSDPDEIRISKKDKNVLLFYKKIGRYYLCVVTKFLKKRGFIITAYWTEKIKEGKTQWKR
ncbi:MAG: DUF4258 domain-containing protein [Candidatus Omnitrophota bacterium]|nr:DUF4258 domain-containing protein [Candidatus Omnitrophota bacterium]